MSRTTMAMLVKFGATFLAAWIAFSYVDGNTLGLVLLVAVIGTVLNYLLGDLVVLPSLGNIVASLGDGGMAALVAYVVDLFAPAFETSLTGLLTFAIIVAVAEYFFHIYLIKSEKVAP